MNIRGEFKRVLQGMGILNWQTMELSGEAYFLSHYLAPLVNPVVLDVGANKGDYSIAARNASPSARIVAFEPHPDTFKQLKGATAGHKIEVLNIGMGSEDGTATLFDRADKTGGSAHASLYSGVIAEIHGKTSVSHPVDIRTLDTFVAEAGIEKIALLKVDTEGHEMAVFRGAEQTIKAGRIEAIQFEFNTTNVISRTFFKDFWDLFSDYDMFRLLPDNAIRIKSYNPMLCEVFAFQNIVCARKPSALYPKAFEITGPY